MFFDALQDWENKWLDPDYDFSLYHEDEEEEEEDDDYDDFLFDVYEDEKLEG